MASTVGISPVRGVDRAIVTLLVDRDADTRELHAEFLRRSGHDVDEAQDGREALAKALSRRPDVIVTGTRLPGMSGFDLCRVLRRDVAMATIPIVFVTGDITEDDIRRAERAGATMVLAKPCLPEKLATEIQQIVIRSRAAGAEAPALRAPAGPKLAAQADEAGPNHRRVMLNHVHGRRMTSEPSIQPPALVCPNCYQPLQYTKSFIGGVSEHHPEQWDYFACRTGCGTFQYRHRTRKLRQTS